MKNYFVIFICLSGFSLGFDIGEIENFKNDSGHTQAKTINISQSRINRANKRLKNIKRPDSLVEKGYNHLKSSIKITGSTYNSVTSSRNNMKQKSNRNMRRSMKVSTSRTGVKEVYVGSTTSQGKQYVIRCMNGSSINGVHRKGSYWYSVASNMGDRYRGLSINGVAQKYCR